MAKNVYLLASDLHLLYKNQEVRINYRDEILPVLQTLYKTAIHYQKEQFHVNLILLGDVFDRSYRSVFRAEEDTAFFRMWGDTIGSIYSVLGNHEVSFYSENPFYTLVKEIESEEIRKAGFKICSPVGYKPYIRIPDMIKDGEVTFYFNHFGTQMLIPNKCETDISIGLFHKNIICSEIVSEMEKIFGAEEYIAGKTMELDRSGYLCKYDYCFFGHFHKVFGSWKTQDGTVLEYLASLGRPNVLEVRDDFLLRKIPCIEIIDGKLKQIKNIMLHLSSRNEAVMEAVVRQKQLKYEVSKACKEARTYDSFGDKPLKNLQYQFSDNPYVLHLLTDLLDGTESNIGIEIRSKIRRSLHAS